jgi:hypothetical protein
MTIRRFATNVTEDKELSEYTGNAIHGELVVNLDEDPPVLYISDNFGNLAAVATVTTVNANSVQVPRAEGTPAGQRGDQIAVSKNGSLASSWLLTFDEANSQIYSRANTFIFGSGPINMQNGAWVQLPDGGMLSPQWNMFQASLGTVLQGVTFPPMAGDPPVATSLSGDRSIPVIINDTLYYIHLSSTP